MIGAFMGKKNKKRFEEMHKKDSLKNESKDETKDFAGKGFAGKTLFIMAFLVVIGFIAGALVGVFYPTETPQPVPELPDGDELGGEPGTVPNGGEPAENFLSKAEISEKVKDFVENSDSIFFQTNSLKDNGFSVNIVSVADFSNDVYEVSFNFMKGTEIQGSSQVFASKDGKKVVFGDVMDLSEPIVYVEPPAPELPKSDKPNVKMFVMTYCPYGQQAEDGLLPVGKLFGDKIEFEPHFVIYSNYATGYPDYCIDENSQYCSMHGINELNEGVRQLCVWKYNKDLFWDYVAGVNENCAMADIETCWKEQAEAVGVDIEKIEECFNSEALDLLETEVQLNTQYSVQGSPTILVNDAAYQGGRSPEAYKQGICGAFNTPPEECEEELSDDAGASDGQC